MTVEGITALAVIGSVWGLGLYVVVTDHVLWPRRSREPVWEQPTVLVHLAADGETLEYPVRPEWALEVLADTLGEIASLPEVPA